jgi:hypothetical protein
MRQKLSAPKPRQPLFQVNVETTEGKHLSIGPAMMQEACAQFAQAIGEQIRLGREKKWRNPQIVPILTLEK